MVCIGHIGFILGHIKLYIGTSWAMLAPYQAHVEPFWVSLGSVLACVWDLGISLSLNFRPCKSFAKNTVSSRENKDFLGCVA